MGLLVLLLGLVFASMYVYRYFFITQVGASREAPLALQPEQPLKLLQPPKEAVMSFSALYCGHSGASLLSSILATRKGLSETLLFPSFMALFSLFF